MIRKQVVYICLGVNGPLIKATCSLLTGQLGQKKYHSFENGVLTVQTRDFHWISWRLNELVFELVFQIFNTHFHLYPHFF